MHKVLLLNSEPDATLRLGEVGDLWDQQLVTAPEFLQLKSQILGRLG